jgi:capsular exopolysaccharide synthesis family protein
VYERFGTRPRITAKVITDTVLIEVGVVDASPTRARSMAVFVATSFGRLLSTIERPSGGQASLPVSVVEEASLPTKPQQTTLTVNLLVGLVVGLVAGVGGALLRNSLDTAVRTARDLVAITDVPVLGRITVSPRLRRHPLPVQDEPLAPFTEAVRQLRANVQFLALEGNARVLVVTSSVRDEGKTSISLNLAVALVLADQRVVLVDADLRRPSVSDALRLHKAQGLAELLTSNLPVSAALHRGTDSGLEVLPSGRPPLNPSELLSSSRMQAIVAELRGRADFVILDAPPLLPVADAAVLAGLADGALLIVRVGRTKQGEVRTALERLEAVGARAFGLVMNRVPTRGPDGIEHSYGYGQSKRKRRAPRVSTLVLTPLEPRVVDVDAAAGVAPPVTVPTGPPASSPVPTSAVRAAKPEPAPESASATAVTSEPAAASQPVQEPEPVEPPGPALATEAGPAPARAGAPSDPATGSAPGVLPDADKVSAQEP